MKQSALRLTALCAALLLPAGAARAVDGVIEINDASILAAGGYPGVITASGSYVLTGNLIPPPGTDALDVFATDVTLDLNGFQISGGGGIAIGIDDGGSGLTVRNGIVTGFGITGINAGANANISHVRAEFNGTGIIAFSSLVVENVVSGSSGTGISADRCKVENNVVQGNGGPGVAGANNVIVHNQIDANVGGGILTMGGSTIQENVINGNTTFGISDGIFGPPPPPPPPPAPNRADIRGNVVNGNAGPGISFNMIPALINDNTVSGNFGTGVACGSACTLNGNLIDSNNTTGLPASGGASVGPGGNVTDNSISFNAGFGLSISILSGYSQNTLNANGPGGLGPNVIPVGGPVHPTSFMFNLCNGVVGPAPTCP